MCTNALSELQPDATTTKRAQYEAFEFDLEAPGLVRVTNGSYGDGADDHSYTVTIEAGVPTSCTCPADEHRSGACKHRVAVAIREPVMDAASSEPVPIPDGGAVLSPETQGTDPEDTDAAGCPHWNGEFYTPQPVIWGIY